MAIQVLMPKLGLTMTEGTIEEWKYKQGDSVNAGDILFSVTTDKLTNDIEAEASGVLLKILYNEGETAACKDVIAWIGAEGEDVPEYDIAVPGSPAPSEAQISTAAPVSPAFAKGESAGFVIASPLAKKLAKEKGLDISQIPGSGPNGRIVAKDVEGFTSVPKMSPTAARVATDLGVDVNAIEANGNRIMKEDVLAAAGQIMAAKDAFADVEACAEVKPEKVSPLRRSIAKNMTESWHTSPRVTFTHPVDATAMIELRYKLKESFSECGLKITYNHILIKACAKALSEFPDINASFEDNMITRHPHANVGLAVAKGDGLIVPNIKLAELKSLSQIAEETERLIVQARDGSISMDSMTDGTFTISSLGANGITNFSPIINQPELAILGVCSIVDTPVVLNGEIVVRPMMNLCLTADHRVIDGVMASGFLHRIAQLLEEPVLMLV